MTTQPVSTWAATAAMDLGSEDGSAVIRYFAALVGLTLPVAKEPQP